MPFYTPNTSRPAAAASVVALEMLDDPIFILDPDDSVSYCNRAARDLFVIPNNSGRTFAEIVKDSDIISPDSLVEQLTLGGKTHGRYLFRRGTFNQTIRVYSQEFRLQRIIRIEFLKWEPAFRHEQLINKIVTMDVEECGQEEMCFQLLALYFELLNADVVIVSMRDDPTTGSKHLTPIAARGVMLADDFRWEMSEEVRDAFKDGRCIRKDAGEWAGVSEFLIIPLMRFSECIGAIHIGVVDPIRSFRTKTDNEPANTIDVIDEEFLLRLQSATSDLVARSQANPLLTENSIATLFSEIQEGMLLMDKAGNIIYATPEAYRVAESTWENMNDKRTYRVCDANGDPMPRAEWPLFQALIDGKEFEDELNVLDFGTHKKPVRFSVRVKKDFLIVRMKDMSDELTRARNQEDFYSSIAHELRTPITPLKGLLQIVSEGIDKESSEFEFLGRSQKQVDRLAKLIEDMLEATRIDSGIFQIKRELVDVSKLVDNLVEDWRLQFPEAQIHGNYADAIVCVLDPYRFEQVICNLIENSMKYCKTNPVIEINLSGSPFVLEIKDNGIGMSDEVIAQVFDRFYQANTGCPNDGVGIGLYVTKKIIDLHGGTISFESEIGKGTTVRVQMPE